MRRISPSDDGPAAFAVMSYLSASNQPYASICDGLTSYAIRTQVSSVTLTKLSVPAFADRVVSLAVDAEVLRFTAATSKAGAAGCPDKPQAATIRTIALTAGAAAEFETGRGMPSRRAIRSATDPPFAATAGMNCLG